MLIGGFEHFLGDVYRKAIEKGTEGMTIGGKSIAEFNKAYGTIINARRLLKIAQSRNQLSLSGRVLSYLLGGRTIEALGGGGIAETIGGGIAENIVKNISTPARSIGAKVLSAEPGKVLKTGAKLGTPFVTGTANP